MKLGPNRKVAEGGRDAAGTVEAEGAADTAAAVVVVIAEGAAADKAEAEGVIVNRKWLRWRKKARLVRAFFR